MKKRGLRELATSPPVTQLFSGLATTQPELCAQWAFLGGFPNHRCWVRVVSLHRYMAGESGWELYMALNSELKDLGSSRSSTNCVNLFKSFHLHESLFLYLLNGDTIWSVCVCVCTCIDIYNIRYIWEAYFLPLRVLVEMKWEKKQESTLSTNTLLLVLIKAGWKEKA